MENNEKLHLRLPFPPTVNSYWVRTKNGMRVSDKGNDYKLLVEKLIHKFKLEYRMEYALEVIVGLFPPDKRIRDVDNYGKGLFDALTEAGLWVDDSQIKLMTVFMGEPIKGGRVDLLIKPYDDTIDYYLKLKNGWENASD